MDWGKKYEKATYPTRTKRTVELFDIREYVKEMQIYTHTGNRQIGAS